MDLQLNGKIALVTGSSKGIGTAIATALAREGAHVVIHGRDEHQAGKVADAIIAAGGEASPIAADLTREDDIERLASEISRRVGGVDILVNNAGGSGPKSSWAETRPVEWTGTFDRNVIAALRLVTIFLPGMRAQHWGRIVNISSAAATMPPPAGPDYAAAKAAMNAMTASLAKAVAAEGVTANVVSPGSIRSERLEQTFRKAAAAEGVAEDAAWDDVEKAVLSKFSQVPMGRVGSVDDIGNAVAFLASPMAGYITGINLRVDGGMSPVL